MSSETVILVGKSQREYAHKLVDTVPPYSAVIVREATRTDLQNAKMWAMIEDIRKAQPMGLRYSKDDWKCVLMKAFGEEVEFLVGLDGKPFPVGLRSSKLSIGKMSDLIEWIYAFGAEQQIQWSEKTKALDAKLKAM